MEIQYKIGDCLELMKKLPDNSVDSIVTDPPYGINFMGKKWDYDIPKVEVWKECLRVLKPGGHILVACGTRTQHRMVVNIEDAGFIIRDIVIWLYGQGFPKSLNIGKAVDKIQGNERESTGTVKGMGKQNPEWNGTAKGRKENSFKSEYEQSIGNSEWEGWGTALKPACELWTLAMKPLSEKTVAKNVLKWGTGGINIDESRVPINLDIDDKRLGGKGTWSSDKMAKNVYEGGYAGNRVGSSSKGRFPANVIHDGSQQVLDVIHDGSQQVLDVFPDSKGQQGNVKGTEPSRTGGKGTNCYSEYGRVPAEKRNDSGSAARFFYCAKASKAERNEGLDGLEERFQANAKFRPNHLEAAERGESGKPHGRYTKTMNFHPTVKPVKLMRYLVRLITPKEGVVLDPYFGSGTTGVACIEEGFNCLGFEMSEEYEPIIRGRLGLDKKPEKECS